MKYLIGAASLLVILIIVFLGFIYSGIYNISAMDRHGKITMWMVNTIKDNSIKHYTDNNIITPNLSDTALVRRGFIHYREMCVGCHGAPGIESMAKGFYPDPPLLTKTVDEWSPQQLFWIIKNGLKMTAMPAFGVTHTDDQIWPMVAFTKMLPTMTKEQYQVFDNATKGQSVE